MRFFLKLLGCAIAAYALAAYMAIPANPEIRFWRSVDQQRDKEIAEVRQANPGKPILFFTGGSSCAFSIDPKIIEETCGIPAFNLGLPVAAGPKYLLHQALRKARYGDILVVALEPDLLTYPESFKAGSFSFGMATLHLEPGSAGGGRTFGESLELREYLNLARPGPGFVATWLAKTAAGNSYRYELKDIRYHGRIETPVAVANLPQAGVKTVSSLCPTGRELLTTFKKSADAAGVRLLYSMPWNLTLEEAAVANKAAHLKILKSISSIIPTVDDGCQGVATDPTFFSDSALHLTAKGSQLRSKLVAKALLTQLALRN